MLRNLGADNSHGACDDGGLTVGEECDEKPLWKQTLCAQLHWTLSQDTIGTLGAVESLVHANIDSTGISPYGRQGAPTFFRRASPL